MKIKPEDYDFLKTRIEAVMAKNPNASIETYAEKGLTETRFVWDLFWASGIKIGDGVGVKGDINLHSYLNDTHITTALRRIVKNYNK